MREAVQKVPEFFNVFWETNVWEVSRMDENITWGNDQIVCPCVRVCVAGGE